MSELIIKLYNDYNKVKNDEYLSCLELTDEIDKAISATKHTVRFSKEYKHFKCDEFNNLRNKYKKGYYT